jgi:alpha-ketoglutarate-dependent taurine dioxygenase
MVWINPATGEKSLQIQQNCVRRLFIRQGPDEEPRVIEDVKEVRELLTRLQLRIIRPEYIYSGPEEEGDHLLWYNWGLMHTRVDYPDSFGVRSAHQAWIPSSAAPVGPTPMPVAGC